MLTFLLKDLQILIGQRNDGNFRQAQEIEQFLLKQPLFREKDITLLHLQLENKNKIITLEKKDFLVKKSLQIFTGDTILTNFKKGEKGTNKTLISMVVADCFPLIFFDQKSGNIAMVHAGWRPLYLGILDQVWQEILELWQTKAQQLWAFLGPGIRAESYCVTVKPLQSEHPLWQQYIKKVSQNQKNGDEELWQINLPAFIKDFLNRQGLPKAQLIDSQLDTYALTKEFFSHRRGQEHLAKGEKQLAQENDGRFLVACQLPS